MEVGTPVWVPDTRDVWRAGTVVALEARGSDGGDGSLLKVELDATGAATGDMPLTVRPFERDVFQRNSTVTDVDDLIDMTHLNEASRTMTVRVVFHSVQSQSRSDRRARDIESQHHILSDRRARDIGSHHHILSDHRARDIESHHHILSDRCARDIKSHHPFKSCSRQS